MICRSFWSHAQLNTRFLMLSVTEGTPLKKMNSGVQGINSPMQVGMSLIKKKCCPEITCVLASIHKKRLFRETSQRRFGKTPYLCLCVYIGKQRFSILNVTMLNGVVVRVCVDEKFPKNDPFCTIMHLKMEWDK